MNGPQAPFDRLRVNGWEEFKKEYVQSIMDPLVNPVVRGVAWPWLETPFLPSEEWSFKKTTKLI
jgi:hypothetical protein